jgi:hypothetical protein
MTIQKCAKKSKKKSNVRLLTKLGGGGGEAVKVNDEDFPIFFKWDLLSFELEDLDYDGPQTKIFPFKSAAFHRYTSSKKK